MTYARLRILTSVVCFISCFFYNDMSINIAYSSLSLLIVLFMILIIQLSSITFYHVIIMYTLFICTSTFFFSYTLIRSLSDNSEFVRSDTECFMLLFRCSMKSYSSRGAGVSLFLVLVFLSLLSFCYFLILDIYQIQFQFFIYTISCVDAYM